jgi:hypothetical protein
MSQPVGIAAAVTSIGDHIVTSLPAQFLVLCLLNVVFIGGVLVFLDRENRARAEAETHAMDTRERVLSPLLAACLHGLPSPQTPAKPQ